MKKLITLLFVIMVMFIMGCGNDTPKNTNSGTPQAAPAVKVENNTNDSTVKKDNSDFVRDREKYKNAKLGSTGEGLHQFNENKK